MGNTSPSTTGEQDQPSRSNGTAPGLWETAVIQAVALAFALGLLVLIRLLAQPLALLFLGIIIATALDPPVSWLSRWIPRGVAAFAVFAALVAVVVAVLWLVMPPLVVQAINFAKTVPHLVTHGRHLLTHLVPGNSAQVEKSINSSALAASKQLLSLPVVIVTSAVDIVLVVFLAIYWLITAPALFNFTVSLAPQHRKQYVRDVLDELGEMLGGYVRGDVLDSLLIGVFAYIGLRVIGVPYALVLALLTAVGDLIPFVGPTVAQFTAAAVAFFQSPLQGAITLGYFLILEQIDGNVTTPLITRGAARIPPMLIVFGLMAGGVLGGILGAIIAIPLAGAIRILLVRVAAPAVRAWWH
jgi:predicted PurR-regulated permease PerM